MPFLAREQEQEACNQHADRRREEDGVIGCFVPKQKNWAKEEGGIQYKENLVSPGASFRQFEHRQQDYGDQNMIEDSQQAAHIED
jgi:hypothetical protein